MEPWKHMYIIHHHALQNIVKLTQSALHFSQTEHIWTPNVLTKCKGVEMLRKVVF